MTPSRRSTIVDVAREAQVSIKTVSRVFNEAENVRPQTRERVMAAASQLKYHPNVVARGLVGGRSYLLGLLFENPSPNYVFDLQAGALDRLSGERYRLVVLPVGSIASVADDILGLVRSAALDGVILTPPACDNPVILRDLSEAGVPMVRIGATVAWDGSPNNFIDDFEGARLAVEHLLKLNHRQIATIKGDPTHPATLSRTAGYESALKEAGIAVDSWLIKQGKFNFESGFAATVELLNQGDRPTAIFAQNDDMAAGAIAAAHDQRISVPAQLSIIGYDDSAVAKVVYPRLTTIHQPVWAMARAAADMLISKLEDRPYKMEIKHSFRLELRESTAPRA
jgi:LacI family transcriptional regulator